MRDYDDWLIDAKALVGTDVFQTCEDPVSGSKWYSYGIGHPLVSLHYVDKAESQLLYRLLSEDEGDEPLEVEKLMRLWPSEAADLGPYAKKIDSVEEAAILVAVLRQIKRHLSQ